MNKSEYGKLWRKNNPQKVKDYNKNAVQDYSQGKIYRIQCNITGDNYYGSTKEKYLSRRLSRHRRYVDEIDKDGKKGKCTSYDIIKRGNYQIILVETYPCKTKYELESRERYYIENNDCVNKNVPTRTVKEKREAEPEKTKEIDKQRNAITAVKRKNTKYFCETCQIEIQLSNKKKHEKRKIHLEKKGVSRRPETHFCTTCNYEMKYDSKIRHEKTKRHLDNL